MSEQVKPGGLLVIRIPNGEFKRYCLRMLKHVGSDLAEQIRCSQAYNNFMTFPYLTGYTRASIKGLLEQFGFATISISGDTILRLADADTKQSAVEEEQRFKSLILSRARQTFYDRRRWIYPWMDVVAIRQ